MGLFSARKRRGTSPWQRNSWGSKVGLAAPAGETQSLRVDLGWILVKRCHVSYGRELKNHRFKWIHWIHIFVDLSWWGVVSIFSGYIPIFIEVISVTLWLFNIAMEHPNHKWRFSWENHL